MLFPQKRQLSLSDPSISGNNRILVTSNNPVTRGYSYKTLILGDAVSLEAGPVTVYPEESGYFPGRKELRVYNHYGLFSYDRVNSSWSTAGFTNSFSDGTSVSPLELLPLYHSPDGRYSVYVKEEENLKLSLYLYDYARECSLLITGLIPRDFSADQVKWSPDSRYFIYRRNRDLYYFSIDQYLSDRIPSEKFRQLGHRYINSVSWGLGNYLYLFSGKLIYRLHSSELFTRSFYADPFQKGAVWGRIPILFDPLFDSFRISPSGTAVYLIKDEQDGFVFSLNRQGEGEVSQSATISVQAGQSLTDSAWLDNHTLLTLVSQRGEKYGSLFSLNRQEDGAFQLLTEEKIKDFTLSPDRTQVALLKQNGVVILDSRLDREIHSFDSVSPLAVYWTDKGYIILGEKIHREIRDGELGIIGLAQVDQAWFSADNGIQVRSGDTYLQYSDNFKWEKLESGTFRPGRFSTDQYRIYLEDRSGGWYAQTLKVRKTASYTTDELFKPYKKIQISEALPLLRQNPEQVPWYFSHGNTQGRKEVCLVINAKNSAEGLNRLMESLDGYGIDAAFFLNGDFINNYPDGTNLIAHSGYTVGSLFYTYFDMSDPKYQINREFLKKGLARNEDDYYITTGQEMAMLWHAPYYYLNREILDTTGMLDYIYIGKELYVPDWIGKNSPETRLYVDTVSLVDQILENVTPGMIIPITLGRFSERDDYLYRQLPMLIEGLILQGYEIVPLFSLMDDHV